MTGITGFFSKIKHHPKVEKAVEWGHKNPKTALFGAAALGGVTVWGGSKLFGSHEGTA